MEANDHSGRRRRRIIRQRDGNPGKLCFFFSFFLSLFSFLTKASLRRNVSFESRTLGMEVFAECEEEGEEEKKDVLFSSAFDGRLDERRDASSGGALLWRKLSVFLDERRKEEAKEEEEEDPCRGMLREEDGGFDSSVTSRKKEGTLSVPVHSEVEDVQASALFLLFFSLSSFSCLSSLSFFSLFSLSSRRASSGLAIEFSRALFFSSCLLTSTIKEAKEEEEEKARDEEDGTLSLYREDEGGVAADLSCFLVSCFAVGGVGFFFPLLASSRTTATRVLRLLLMKHACRPDKEDTQKETERNKKLCGQRRRRRYRYVYLYSDLHVCLLYLRNRRGLGLEVSRKRKFFFLPCSSLHVLLLHYPPH